MRIEIEFDNSYDATLVIDGREMCVVSKPGITTLKGHKGRELEETFGGLVASQLYTKIADIQQAWAAAEEEQPGFKTWDFLNEEAVEAVCDKIE